MSRLLTTIGFKTLDKDHRVLSSREQPSRSWTRHFFDHLYVLLGYISTATLTGIQDITATGRDFTGNPITNGYGVPYLYLASPAGGVNGVGVYANGVGSPFPDPQRFSGDTYGIVVGTGNAAVTTTDNALQTKINHGTGAGLLEHGGTEVLVPTFADPNGSMVIRRYFTNNSGGAITVEESGLYARGWTSAGYTYIFCIARDVTGGVVVPDTQLLVVTYTAQITV